MTGTRRTAGLGLRAVLLGVVVVFMFAPTVVMAVLSFSGETVLAIPPREWGLRQYHEVLLGDRWLAPLRRSFVVGGAAAGLALAAGALAALAVGRSRVRGRTGLHLLAIAPLLVPSLAYAIALYVAFAELHLLGTRTGLVLAHAVLAVPFVVLVLGGALTRVPRELESAAMSLGASRARAWWDVTLKLLVPAALAAFILAFLTSFDEVVVTSFVAGVGYQTVPKVVFDDIRTGVDPAIAALGVLMTALTALLLLLVALLRRRAR